jgi:glutamine amidotransferase
MIGILKMPIANIRSVWNGLYEQGHDPVLVDERFELDGLTHLIVPGVGHFQAVMENLVDRGLPDKIRAYASSGRPLLGICVGMQVLATWGTEGSRTAGLDIVAGTVVRLNDEGGLRLPHVGWNNVELRRGHPIFDGLKSSRDFYFTHSYCLKPDNPADSVGETTYGGPFTCVVAHDNVVGFQFHPEKSQVNGLKLLDNFCRWNGTC